MRTLVPALAAVAFLAACGAPATTGPATTASSPTAPSSSAPTAAPGTGTKAAASSTATPAATSGGSAARTVIASGLSHPWGVAFLPDGSALLTQRDSPVVWRLRGAGQAPVEVGRVEGMVPSAGDGEGGLLGVAVSPTFATDHRVYLYLTTADDNRVVVLTYGEAGLRDQQVLLAGIPRGAMYHQGGRLAFGPDGMLYVTTGDAKDGARAQERADLGGKILRLAPDGSVPADNPFPGSPVWSMGHRNVQGLVWDKAGRMVASELGEKTVDEVNVITPGANHGWPTVEGRGGTAQGFVDPVATWTPTSSCSPSGIAFDASGTNLLVGCLAGKQVSRIAWHDGAPSDPATWLSDLGRVRGLAQAPDGSLWAWTDNGNGQDQVVSLRG